ncbi:MAG: TIGR04255 family protein [Anaerolineae bacterium]|nr:TIGR04255 family protein [Anaerolineae bacterium]
MPFPNKPRVIYDKNPLDQVICQLRFPPVLRIDSEIPASFQDRIRAEFSNFSEKAEIRLEMPGEMKEVVPPEILRRLLQSTPRKNYEFSSEDGLWKLNLTRSFIALTASRYERWESFKEKLQLPLQALIDIYAPTYFSRIGLRYIDVIRPSQLNLQNYSWIDLLQPYILGMLASPDVGEHIRSFESRHDVDLADGESKVRIVTRFVTVEDNNELCYMIDSDFFNTNKTEITDTLDKLDFFSLRGTRLFQWCITEQLHDAMEPQRI